MNVDLDTFDAVRGEFDSLGGLILEIAGKIPEKNERLNFDRYQFEILDVSSDKIERVEVTITPDENEEEES